MVVPFRTFAVFSLAFGMLAAGYLIGPSRGATHTQSSPSPASAPAAGWTHESIADLLGCARQTVTKTLNEFARAGWIRVERKRVFVIDHHALERLVGPTSAPMPERSVRRHEPHESR